MSCPKCDSTKWKLASLVHREGLSHIETTTTGFVYGGDAISATSSGTQQTAQSLAAAPPVDPSEKVRNIFFFIFAALSYLLGNATDSPILFGAIFAFVGGAFGIFIAETFWIKKPKNSHQVSLDAWAKKRMCLRCGHFYAAAYVTQLPLHGSMGSGHEAKRAHADALVIEQPDHSKKAIVGATEWQTPSPTRIYVNDPARKPVENRILTAAGGTGRAGATPSPKQPTSSNPD